MSDSSGNDIAGDQAAYVSVYALLLGCTAGEKNAPFRYFRDLKADWLVDFGYQCDIPCGAVLDAHSALISGNDRSSAGQLGDKVMSAVADRGFGFKYPSAYACFLKDFQ